MITITPGARYNDWTALRPLPGRRAPWLCRCTCGDEGRVPAASLVRGKSTRCRRCAVAASRALRRSETVARPIDFSPGRVIEDGPRCPRCHLLMPRGGHSVAAYTSSGLTTGGM